MVAMNPEWSQSREEWIAYLTDVAYRAVLDRGYKGSFLELELSLWRDVRRKVEQSWPVEVRSLAARNFMAAQVV